MYFSTAFGARLLALLLTAGCSLAASPACGWFPTSEFRDRSLACSGPRVTAPPRLLPPTLQTLRLSETGLRVLDGDVFSDRQLPRLRHLSITDGVLSSVKAGALCSLAALTVLDLSNNRIHHVDTSSFECNHKLRRVDLSGNPGLGRLPALVSDSIETLDADHCNIANVDVAELQGLPALKVLHLIENPDLDCWDVKTRLFRAHPSLLVICNNSSSVTPMFSGTTNISSPQPRTDISKNLPTHTTTYMETDAGSQIDSQNSVTQLRIEDQEISTVIKGVLHSTTEVPVKQKAETIGQSRHSFKKINNENFLAVTHPNEFSDLDSTFVICMCILLSLILLSLLIICCLNRKA